MSESGKKGYAYKGPINPEYLEWFGFTEEEARAELSARMQPPRFFVSNKTFEFLKKEGLLNKDGSLNVEKCAEKCPCVDCSKRRENNDRPA